MSRLTEAMLQELRFATNSHNATTHCSTLGALLMDLDEARRELAAAKAVTREAAYTLVEQELRESVVRISLPYAGRCVVSGRFNGEATEASEHTLIQAVDALKAAKSGVTT
jgi:hypothetical protein